MTEILTENPLAAIHPLPPESRRAQFTEVRKAWLKKHTSPDTRSNYQRDLTQFMDFAGIPYEEAEQLAKVLPRQVAEWRDYLQTEKKLTNASIRRKLTVLRSLFSYLQAYGFTSPNPVHGDFVDAPASARDGKTVGLSPHECRLLLDAPVCKIKDERTGQEIALPAGIRDRALLAVLAYTGIRVGELCRLCVGDYKSSSGLKLLEVHGKGGKERRVALHPQAIERIEQWLDCAGLRDDAAGPLFRPVRAAWGRIPKQFMPTAMTRRAVQHLVGRYIARLKLEPSITVHSFRVTALTTARENGSDIIDLQDFAGHADPRTTLTYIRNRDRLSKSPAYLLRYD